MEGLEINELFISQLIDNRFRIDAEYYQKKYLELVEKMENFNSETITSLNITLDCSAFYPSIVGDYNFKFDGIPFLRVDDIKDGFVSITDKTAFLSPKILVVNESTIARAFPGDIIIAKGGNTLGKIGLLTNEYDEYSICRDVLLLRTSMLDDSIRYYLWSFLNSVYGYESLFRTASQTGQPHLTLASIGEILVPSFNQQFKSIYKELFQKIGVLKKKADLLYEEAKDSLLSQLNFKLCDLNQKNKNTKSLKESFLKTGRLDAEYYQSKYESYYHVITNYLGGFSFIKDEFEHIIYTSFKKEKGYYYIEIGDVNVSDGSCQANYIETEALPTNAKIIAEKGDILISKVRPNRGAISIIETNYKNLIVSGAFTVLITKDNSLYSNELLKVLLRLPIYRDWLLQFNVGTQYPVIKDEDILNLPIPLFSKQIQNEVTVSIRQAGQLKNQSEQLLQIAKTAVEIAIEQNEEVAIDYINSHSELMSEDGNLH